MSSHLEGRILWDSPGPTVGDLRPYSARRRGASVGTMSIDTSPSTDILPDHTCWELLRQTTVGRLAVVADGAPDLFPVNYVVDHGTVIFRTASGTKLAAAKTRPVAFEADGYDTADGTAWSVVLKGVAERILELSESISAMALPLTPWHDGNKPWFVRIVPSVVSGRRLHVTGGSRLTVVNSSDPTRVPGNVPRPGAHL